jgi:hypothetical protein
VPVFPELRFPFLEYIILGSPVLMTGYDSFLPLFVSFLGSIQTTSFLSLTLHLQFQRYSESHRAEPLVPDWSFIVNFLVHPIFRHPIELYIDQDFMDDFDLDVPSSLEENPDLSRMQADGQLMIICDEEYSERIRAR